MIIITYVNKKHMIHIIPFSEKEQQCTCNQKATLYIYAIESMRNVFSLFLNRKIVDTLVSFKGRLFQNNGPHTRIL